MTGEAPDLGHVSRTTCCALPYDS